LFDLDHTLLPIDSDYAWGVFTQDIGWTDPVVFKEKNDAFYEHYKAGTLDVHDYVRFATEAVRMRGREQAEAAHARFMQAVIQPAIRAEALTLVRQHQAAGEQVVIVTATNEFVTRPIADALGVQELIAVRLATGADGWITGEIDGVPSMREGKVTRVADWLGSQGLGWGSVETTFYSDSMNDLPLLERVQHPVATNPDARLRAVAQQRGWRILDLFSPEKSTVSPSTHP
jgi:HAD superfamily hydrolase (TIGR01490 family)